ncbi:HP1 family phage holin [Pseudoalteromonas sp. APC 3691]|uniref:HP1 family phage holin n=1 Tax=Pseudoalteromonas sp. APC 3691 TaxID=3035173 RepID=UPI0025B288AE|nr:HP1 family phage holin [Pseudoalteromonas sp. APC 3691]MDN3390868.1 HP1 family phage holin [Pseudoalteromonas sp. APC 3691]
MKTLTESNSGPVRTMDKSTTVASYTASIGTAAGGLLSLNTIALILGIIFTAATFFINWRSQHKRHQLELAKRAEDAEFHRARMAELLKDDERALSELKDSNGDK